MHLQRNITHECLLNQSMFNGEIIFQKTEKTALLQVKALIQIIVTSSGLKKFVHFSIIHQSSFERGTKLSSNYPANISTSVQRCFWVDMTLRRRTTSNQRWNNVVYVNVEIHNVEQRWNNVVFFNVELNNVRQRRNNVVIVNVDCHNVGQRQNNVANMTIWKK